MSAPLHVAGLQLDIAWEDPTENFRRADVLAGQATALGARLLVLPEMFATGFSMAAQQTAAHAGATRDYLAQLAQRHGVWVLGGYAEPGDYPPQGAEGEVARSQVVDRDVVEKALGTASGAIGGLEVSEHEPPRPRNAAALFDPAGTEVLRYHKIHPFSYAGEHEHYAGGTALRTVSVEGVRVTPVICYDLRFAEPFRVAALDTDLFLVVANWPSARRNHWSTLLAARAIENQCYVLGVNRVGEGDGLVYAGDSALYGPLGETLALASEQPAVVAGAVDPGRVAAMRERFSFLADRRPEVYSGLTPR